MLRSWAQRWLGAAALALVLPTFPAAAATLAFGSDCIRALTATCAGIAEVPGPDGTGTSDPDSGLSRARLPLIVTFGGGAALLQSGPDLVLLRLLSGIPGADDARLWLVDAGRHGELRLFCLRFRRQTWTAGHIGEIPMGLPLAAMIASQNGALALGSP